MDLDIHFHNCCTLGCQPANGKQDYYHYWKTKYFYQTDWTGQIWFHMVCIGSSTTTHSSKIAEAALITNIVKCRAMSSHILSQAVFYKLDDQILKILTLEETEQTYILEQREIYSS